MVKGDMSESHDHHSHDHHHDHNHGLGHSHAPKVNEANRKRVGLAAILTGLFMIAEVVGGLVSGSLALLADAGHMLTDFAALAMAWGAFQIARRPANWKHTFGYDRFSILVAFVNGLTLFLVAVWILWEAAQRIMTPTDVLAGPMFYVAVGGLVVNLLVLWILRGADQHNLNIRGATLHVLGDLLGSVAAIAAAIIIWRTGWMPIDPILSVVVAFLILKSAWSLFKDSAHILLEGAPDGLDSRAITADLQENIKGLIKVDHIHIWSITPDRPMMTLEAIVEPKLQIEPISKAIKARLESQFHVDYATVEVRRAES